MKLLLLGLSGVGKSTVAPRLGQTLGLEVLEIDDETERLNGGIWPESEEVIDNLFARIVKDFLETDTDSILFVTSYLLTEEIAAFYKRGFVIIELHAALPELVKRKRQRGDALDSERIYRNYGIYKGITDNPSVQCMLRLSIDTTQRSSVEVKQLIVTALNASKDS